MKKSKILYISYDGLLEPLGESQILSYQYKIANKVVNQAYICKRNYYKFKEIINNT